MMGRTLRLAIGTVSLLSGAALGASYAMERGMQTLAQSDSCLGNVLREQRRDKEESRSLQALLATSNLQAQVHLSERQKSTLALEAERLHSLFTPRR